MKFIEKGVINSRKNFIITSLHGESSEIIRLMENRLEIVLSLGKQIIRALKVLHSLGYVHGDIKPQNILFNINWPSTLAENTWDLNNKFVLIDFGVSRKYVDEHGVQLSQSKVDVFKGNLEFAASEWLQKIS